MNKSKKFNLKLFLANVIIPLAVGGLSTLLTSGNMEKYGEFKKPMLSPPDILFPIVWTILFIIMGISSYLIVTNCKDADEKRKSLIIYSVQLFLNFCWTLIFFNLNAFLFAFIWIILLWIAILLMILQFRKTNRIAAYLQIPYLLWVTFAAYLNLGVYLLNR